MRHHRWRTFSRQCFISTSAIKRARRLLFAALPDGVVPLLILPSTQELFRKTVFSLDFFGGRGGSAMKLGFAMCEGKGVHLDGCSLAPLTIFQVPFCECQNSSRLRAAMCWTNTD